ncbi:MAG: hypothetical protein KDK27_11970, partial [Leptospiraceae bacterium]|nr:hypothetical protein [Leptospiraceae bacterium]
KLLGNNIFGIHHYFPEIGYEDVSLSTLHRMHRNPDETPLMPDVFYTCHVTTVEENNVICDMIGEVLHRAGAPSVIRMVIEELAANAMLHAPGRTREEREAMQQQARKSGPVPVDHPAMAEEDAFQISFGLLSGQAVIAVTDFHGTLDRDEVLYRLERQVTVDSDNNLPVGLTDFHGRGLYISREQVDHLIFNIAPDRKTEIIGILPLDSNVRSRAISIFQKK